MHRARGRRDRGRARRLSDGPPPIAQTSSAVGVPPRIAAFVSPHGFGHAARSSAVMAEAHRRGRALFELFTTVPRWFFEESIPGTFRLHEEVVDVGFRQRSALRCDPRATAEALGSLVPFDDRRVKELAASVRAAGCHAVLCDIAPLGVAVAEAAGLPSLLVENFSWGWLYEPFGAEVGGLLAAGAELDAWAARATAHVQTRPLCVREPRFEAVDPIGRRPRLDRAAARGAFGFTDSDTVVVVTMGGYGEDLPFLDRLREMDEVRFLVTGAGHTEERGNLMLFDNRTPLYMPDVLRAADGVVAKLGYGTIAEVWGEGLPFAHVTRPDFPEMPPLEAFAATELSGFLLDADAYAEGAWIDRIPELLALPRRPHAGGGADRVAELLLDLAE